MGRGNKKDEMQSLRDENDRLKKRNHQLESEKKTLIAEKDGEIARLKNGPELRITKSCAIQTTPSDKDFLIDTQCPAVIKNESDNAAYFASRSTIWKFDLTYSVWGKLSPPNRRFRDFNKFSLVSIDDELTTVGGNANCKTLYTQDNISKRWIEKYPPMPTGRSKSTAVYIKSHILVVAGGCKHGGNSLDVVEVLNTCKKLWFKVSSLSFATNLPSMAICGEFVYLHAGYMDKEFPNKQKKVLKCSLLSLSFSAPRPEIWKETAALPIKKSTIMSIQDQLLAVGGEGNKQVHQYNSQKDIWQVIGEIDVERCLCTAGKLLDDDDKFLVMGGGKNPNPLPVEIYTVHAAK